MKADRSQQIFGLYHQALGRDEAHRAALLDEACGHDDELRREVESLLAKAPPESFLATPALEDMAAETREAPDDLLIGREIGAYRVVSRLGSGGMGEVYRARDTILRRDVALKVLPASFALDPDRRARFTREAQILASLNHPNIAAIYGFEDASGVHALAMELVDGPTLAERIVRGPIPLEEALPIAKQIADALEAAHEKGVVHRDLKPANIAVRRDGTVKVLDFGLARLVQPDASAAASEAVTSPPMRTEAGMILGTPAYMAPEQARGQVADPRADIWAFGCVLFEMLAGERAFNGDDVTDTVAAVVSREPHWEALPAAASGVRPLLGRCLKKAPRQRLQAIGDARIQIEELIGGSSEAAPTTFALAATPSRRAASIVIAALVGGALVGGLMWAAMRPPASARVRFEILPPANATFADMAFRLSPDGRNLAYVAMAPDRRRRLWVHSFETGEARMLAVNDVESPAPVVWSPDGRFLAFTSEGKIKKIAVEGGSPQTLLDAQGGANDWSREDVLLFVQNLVVKRMPASGGTATPLTALDATRQEISHYFPRLLPDGRHFVYLRRSLAEETSGVYIGSIDARPEEQDLTRLVANAAMAVYAPGPEDLRIGHLLFNRGETLLAQRFDAGALRLEGDELPVAERVAVHGNPSQGAFFSASSNGILAYRQDEIKASTPVWVNRAGVELAAITQSPVPGLEQIRLSPDGTRLAVIVRGDIWVYDLDGRPPIKLTSAGGVDTPYWSPDGHEIVYARSLPPFRLFSVPIEVGATPTPVSPLGHYHPHGWSPDGRDLIAVLNSYSSSGWDILKVPWRRDGAPEPLVKTASNDGMFGAALSSDGRWFAYTLNATGNHEIWVRPYAGSAPPVRVSANGGADPQWARDGTELYFVENLTRVMAVAVRPGTSFNFTPPRLLFEQPFPIGSPLPNQSYDVAPDGTFVMIRPAPSPASPTPITVVLNWASGLTN